jgi:polysaccharide biosynthesis protein PelB
MLLDRSKRYAGLEGDIPRLGLTSNWHLLMVVGLLITLLVFIFPRKTLIDELYAKETIDQLSLDYIENLYQADPKNADFAILLAKSRQDKLDIDTLESMLLPWVHGGDARQKNEVRLILAHGYEKALKGQVDSLKRTRLKTRLTQLIEAAQLEGPISDPLAATFAQAAFAMGSPKLGLAFLQQIDAANTLNTIEAYGDQALGQGDYRLAAEYFLMIRDESASISEASRMFRKGIGALMAGSYFDQALTASEQHLGDLADDPPTLRYLIQTALAAGKPQVAASHAARLVFKPSAAVTHP